ncbi:WhiB family transcriptional regulator [Streptomyces sp. NRRL F-5135]|uniref:WhiB family transcriptional regulator n=1 Tax=Streptomyces sp. NRRL F-5135 TaxID=1463858 RepID=UPI0004CB338A|nr:WhiB family transcriptional regulator [Streptomyces sp. NRRL F-5135]
MAAVDYSGAPCIPKAALFARDDKAGMSQAQRVCWGWCPVRVACLEEALDQEAGLEASSRGGIRGGVGPAERARLDRATARMAELRAGAGEAVHA